MKKIKLIFISTLILILILGLNTTVLGAKSWNQAEFETFMEYMGYGEINLDEFTFPNGMTKSNFLSNLSNTNTPLLILKYSDSSSANEFSKTKFTVSFDTVWQFRQMYFNNSYYAYALDPYESPFNQLRNLRFDLENKTITYASDSNGSDFTYIPYNWYKANNNVTEEEWTSLSYKTYLFEQATIFCDQSIAGTSYIPQGGKITSSSYDNTIYEGTITYSPSLRTVEWNLTNGFIEGQEYALFLNEWTTSNDFEYGLRDYNDGYIVFNNINTLTGSRTISNFNFETRANQVYEFCIGLRSGDSNEYIELIKTDWLIPNDNTLFLYPNFTRSHYFQLLNLVAYNPDTELPPDTGEDEEESGDQAESGDNSNIDFVGGLNDFWGNKDNIKQEDFEKTIEDEINGVMNNISGELSKQQIIEELTKAESGFLNFFKEEKEEKFYDLVIAWNNVELYGAKLIPAGSINFSQICRDIEILGTLQTLTRTISCFIITILLIKQIYNLILATLGIDNPYLYEDETMEIENFMDTDTGQSYRVYRGTATDGTKYRIKKGTTKLPNKRRIGF